MRTRTEIGLVVNLRETAKMLFGLQIVEVVSEIIFVIVFFSSKSEFSNSHMEGANLASLSRS